MAESEPLIRANGYIIVHLLLWKQQAPNQQVMIIITHAITHMTVTMTTTVYIITCIISTTLMYMLRLI